MHIKLLGEEAVLILLVKFAQNAEEINMIFVRILFWQYLKDFEQKHDNSAFLFFISSILYYIKGGGWPCRFFI